MNTINYEAEVKKVYPQAIVKRYSSDFTSPFYVVCEADLNFYDESSIISRRCKLKKNVWQSAYIELLKQGKIKTINK